MNSGDEMVLVDNLDKTGPVLESLSNRSANDILSTFASFLSQQQFMTSIIPWLQQALDLSSGHDQTTLYLQRKQEDNFWVQFRKGSCTHGVPKWPLIGDLLHSWYQDCIKFGVSEADAY
ncbi:tortifolia1-like protein 2, partial [Tanacetum coccineum]